MITSPDCASPVFGTCPGGGTKGNETPEECIVRELQEECRFTLPLESIVYKVFLPSLHDPTLTSCFMVATITEADIEHMQFGTEGSRWQLMPISEYLNHPEGITPLLDRFRGYFDSIGSEIPTQK